MPVAGPFSPGTATRAVWEKPQQRVSNVACFEDTAPDAARLLKPRPLSAQAVRVGIHHEAAFAEEADERYTTLSSELHRET